MLVMLVVEGGTGEAATAGQDKNALGLRLEPWF